MASKHYNLFSLFASCLALEAVLASGTTPAIVSMSLGGGASAAEDLVIKKVYDAGFVVSVAAGNDNADACFYSPAGAPEVRN